MLSKVELEVIRAQAIHPLVTSRIVILAEESGVLLNAKLHHADLVGF